MKANAPVCFSFQYYVDLGHNQVGNIFINQESDPYVESSKFCAKYQLSSIIITILGDAIQEQMKQERQLALKRISLGQERKAKQGIFSLKTLPYESNTLQTEFKEECSELEEHCFLKKQSKEKLFTHAADRANVFLNLYNNHKEIQLKKELSRKKSLESFTFKPQINHLSDKIITNKRKITQSHQNMQKRSVLEILEDKKVLVDKNTNNNCSQRAKIKYSVTRTNTSEKKMSRQSSRQSIFQRNQTYSKKTEEKRKKLKESLEKKLMENCLFKPKINSKVR